MAAPRLTYFDMRGRAEAIRLLLHATGTPFDDRRVVSAQEWQALQPTLPFERLPVFETDGRLLCESHAILRFLGSTLLSRDADALAEADLGSAHDVLAELQEELWRFHWRDDWDRHLESFAESELRPGLTLLEAWLGRTDGPWLGAELSEVDCLAFCYLDEIDAFLPAVLEEFPELTALHGRVSSRPGIADYLASSARPPVFGMGSLGPKIDPRVPIAPGRTLETPWTEPIDLARMQGR